MKKCDVFQKYEEVAMKRKQIVFLDYNGFSADEIAEFVDYAVSTIKNYARKFASLLEEAKKTFYVITLKTKQQLKGGRQYVYLFKFYDKMGKLICSKVGTTTRLPEQRIKEEMRYYRNHGIDVASNEICSVIDCGDNPAEGAESCARAHYIKKFPKQFCKNDRFFGVDISTQSFNKVVKEYLG